MHMFQSSWNDFSDFEKIFVRIKNTISGQPHLLYVMSCHVMLRHVTSCRITLHCIMSCYVMSCHVTSCYIMLCHTEYVMQHWKEDFMFGYQFLNGCNPVVIRKCTKLPDKFPVTHEMVSVSLERDLTLEQEIQVDIIMSVSLKQSFVSL